MTATIEVAMAETVSYVNRARAFMPPGTVPPFITRFDAGSVPVGNLVFTSTTRSVGEMQDAALRDVARRVGATAFRRQCAHDSDQRESGALARLQRLR